MTVELAKEKLRALQAKMAAYGHATSLIYYDGVTTAPKGTAANRGQTLSILSSVASSKGRDEARPSLIAPHGRDGLCPVR